MPLYVQLVYLEHAKMHLVNGEFELESVNVTNGSNAVVVLRLFSTVIHVISLKSEVFQ